MTILLLLKIFLMTRNFLIFTKKLGNIADGEIAPACAQTCPSQAIVFGNLRDETSRAQEQVRSNPVRSYHALHVLNTRPAVSYLARVVREPSSRIEEGSHHAAATRDGKETS